MKWGYWVPSTHISIHSLIVCGLERGKNMGAYSDAAITLLKSKLDHHEPIDMPAVVLELKSMEIALNTAFAELLQDRKAFDWHYYAIAGMRTLAEQDDLPAELVWPLLEATNHLAWRMGLDEFFKSIDATARSSKTAPRLLDFVARRLLEDQDIQEWQWLAFTAVGAVHVNQTAEIPRTLVDRLRYEASNVPPARHPQLEEFINNL
jgi:hypothetical protein